MEAKHGDYWARVKSDNRLATARRKLSFDELRMIFQHARDALADAPRPDGPLVRLSVDVVPYSSVVGGGLMLKRMDGRAAFLVNFIGTTEGITKEETTALVNQFAWFMHTYGAFVPERPAKAESSHV